MNMPLKLKWVLTLNFLLVSWVLVQMGLRINHQLSDMPNFAEGSNGWRTVVHTLFTEHLIMEHLFNIAMILFSAVVVFSLIEQFILHYKLSRYLSTVADPERSALWTRRLDASSTQVIVIKESAFAAMAYGIFNCRIVISTGVLSRFSDEEVRAILYHELYHCRSHHPLQSVIWKVVSTGFVFIPLIKDLSRYYEIWMELLADRYAIKRMKVKNLLQEFY
ncbi:M56 family metallopeptidase [Paenibacillus sp. 1P07SE]|uniref:M56 family metallopeptidase n=1 Tax=Paenibacillus sp. 1P07SE TaxID=3132209 RepID=UPI0039A517E6